jgi:hypothetical protein
MSWNPLRAPIEDGKTLGVRPFEIKNKKFF